MDDPRWEPGMPVLDRQPIGRRQDRIAETAADAAPEALHQPVGDRAGGRRAGDHRVERRHPDDEPAREAVRAGRRADPRHHHRRCGAPLLAQRARLDAGRSRPGDVPARLDRGRAARDRHRRSASRASSCSREGRRGREASPRPGWALHRPPRRRRPARLARGDPEPLHRVRRRPRRSVRSPGEERDRLVCAACGHIAYVNPRLVVSTIPVTDAGEVVLLAARLRAGPRVVGPAGRLPGGRRDRDRGRRPGDVRGDRPRRRAR